MKLHHSLYHWCYSTAIPHCVCFYHFHFRVFLHESMTGFRPVYFKWAKEADIQWLGNVYSVDALWRKAEYDDTMLSCCFNDIWLVMRRMTIHKKHSWAGWRNLLQKQFRHPVKKRASDLSILVQTSHIEYWALHS